MDSNGRNRAEMGEETQESKGVGGENELLFSGGGIKPVRL